MATSQTTDTPMTTGRMVVVYDTPADPAKFEEHYASVHIPLAMKLPGLRRYEVGRAPIVAVAGGPPPYLVAILTFDSLAAIRTAFDTPEGRACGADRRVLAPNDNDVRIYLFESTDA